jgi:hypothetical protein
MAKLSDLSKHPEKLTDQDIKDFSKLVDTVSDFGQSLKGYNFNFNANITPDRISYRFYHEHLVMSAILDAFYRKSEVTYRELNDTIFNSIPKEMVWNSTLVSFQNIILKMTALELIIRIETSDKYMPVFKITEDGFKALQQQTYNNLAATSFFNYRTHLLNKRSFWMSVIMIIVAILSVIVAILAVFYNKN